MATKVGPLGPAHCHSTTPIQASDSYHSLQFLGAQAAAALDKELMSSGAFSIDQLMELAGLSVSQAGTAVLCHLRHQDMKRPADRAPLVYRVQPPSSGRRILVACGPGNNGVLQPVTRSKSTGLRADLAIRW